MGTHINGARNDGTRRVLDSIRRIVQALRVASRASEGRFGLSAARLFVLHKLAESASASVNELAARTLTHQSSVSVVVQKLEARGLVTRSAAIDDGRRAVISLSAKGRALIAKAPRAAQEKLIEAIDALPKRRRAELAEILEALADGAAENKLPPPLFFEEVNSNSKRKRHAAPRR